MPKDPDADKTGLDVNNSNDFQDNARILLVSKNSNNTRVKKQVRFVDTEGEGPLTRVMKQRHSRRRPRKASKNKAEQVQKSKNSCACVIF
jgi:hypothetical protein